MTSVVGDTVGESPAAKTPASSTVGRVPLQVIEPPGRWPGFGVDELWKYRELLFQLAWRDVSARYRQSVLGIGWAVIRPIASMLIFTVIFGRVARFSSDGVPYAIFSFSGLLPWFCFSTCLSNSSASLVSAGSMLKKIYFPRLLIPVSRSTVGITDVAIQFVCLLGLMAYFGVSVSWQMVFAPFLIFGCALSALSIGLWLAALNVKYRDVTQAVPFLVQTWMWITPIVYSASMIPERWRPIYALNPMVGVVEAFRWSTIGTPAPDLSVVLVSGTVMTVCLIGGWVFFRRAEPTFADIV